MNHKTILAAAVLAMSVAGGGEAMAASTVLGNGLGNFCSAAAMSGDHDQRALETCTLALETEAMRGRDRAGTFVNRGVIKMRRKDYVDARADFDAALKIEPALGEAFVNRGATYLGERRFEEALAEIDKGLALGADEPEKAYYNRALVYEGLGDVKAAYFDYLKALELKPDWDFPRNELTRFTVSRP